MDEEDINRENEVLAEVRQILTSRYPSFHITEGRTFAESMPFLHLWKKKTDTWNTGLTFLPDFHVIVTLDILVKVELKFALYTFHGKSLCQQIVTLDDLPTADLLFMNDLDENSIVICRGFNDAQIDTILNNASACDWGTELFDQMKRLYLIETYSDKVIVRSAECDFFCKDGEAAGYRCLKCMAQDEEEYPKLDIVEAKEIAGKATSSGEECQDMKDSPPDISNVLRKFPGVQIFKTNKEPNLPMLEEPKLPIKVERKSVVASSSKHFSRNESNPVINFGQSDVKEEPQDMGDYQDYNDDDGYDQKDYGYDNTDNGVPEIDPQMHCEAYLDDLGHAQPRKKKRTQQLQMPPYRISDMKSKTKSDNSEIFSCKVCFSKHNTEAQRDRCVVSHERHFDLEVDTQCPRCEFQCGSRLQFCDHYLKEHSGESDMCCCVCLTLIKGDASEMRTHIIKEHHSRSASKKGRIVTVRSNWVRNVYEVIKDAPPKKIDVKLLQNGYKSSKDSKILYECKVCLRKSENWDSIRACFRQHEKVWGLDQEIQCPLCNESLPRGEVTYHFEMKHFDVHKQCCCHCLAVVDSKEGKLRTHILKEHGESFRSILCTWCGRHFHNNLRLSDHIARVHEKPSAFLCTECGTSWPTKVDFRYHMQTHDPKVYKCPHCDKTFKDRRNLYNHLFTHTNYKPFRCSLCDYAGFKRYHVQVHIKNAHNRKGSKAELVTDEVMLEELRNIVKHQTRQINKTIEGPVEVNN